MKFRICIICLFVASALFVGAQQDTSKKNLDNMSLLDLMKEKLKFTEKSEQATKDNPNLLTTIYGKDIRNSGARDLIDVLRLVPGIYFAYDLDNIVSIGIRGNWAQEGKVLLLIDNQEMNESSYGNLVFNNHYPVDNIEQIDVIRGPASAQYGGNASMAVIHVITRRGGDVSGIKATFTSGQFDSANARRSLEVMAGGMTLDSTEWSIQGYAAAGNMSTRTSYSDKDTVRYLGNSGFKNGFGLIKVSTKSGWHFRSLLDAYQARATIKENDLYFRSGQYSIRKDQKINKYLTISPRVILRTQSPWNWASAPLSWSNSRNRRITARVTGSYLRPLKNGESESFFGLEYFNDFARFNDSVGGVAKEQKLSYNNYSLFLHEAYYTKKYVLQGGFRVEKHTLFGPVFVPRVSLSHKVKKYYNAKLIYSRAFRAPAILTLYYATPSAPLKPEKLRNIEGEISYEKKKGNFVKISAYQVFVKDPIVYSQNGFTDVDEYTNKTRTGSYGAEAELRYAEEDYSFYASYTYAHQYRNEVADFRVVVGSDSSRIMLAMPLHKVAASFHYLINKQFAANVNCLFESHKYGYAEDSALRYFNPILLANVALNYRDKDGRFEASVSVADLFNQKYNYAQAYRSAYGSLPGAGRELLIRLRINLKKNTEY